MRLTGALMPRDLLPRDWRARLVRPICVALCAALTYPALAQEGGPPAGGDVPTTGGDGGGKGPAVLSRAIEPAIAPRYGSAGLWRRANVKALITNAPGASRPATGGRPAPLPVRPGLAAAPRNAIGVTLPTITPSPGHRVAAGWPAQAGAKPVVMGATTGPIIRPAPQMANPATPAQRGAAINGTAMARPVSGSIGGPSRDRSGINGTLMPRKY